MAEAVAGSDDGSTPTVNVLIDEQTPSGDAGSRMLRTRARGRRRLQEDVSFLLFCIVSCIFI